MAARAVFVSLIAGALVLGVWATGRQETGLALAQAGTDWANLLRAMAVLKAAMAVGASGAVIWRLGSATGPIWLSAYVLAGTAMMAGPGLIWGLVHVGLGALLLHAGLAATILLLWRDPQVTARLTHLIAARRAKY